MNDNILAYLLLILIVYLIFKISKNTCNGFNVGSQMEPPTPLNLDNNQSLKNHQGGSPRREVGQLFELEQDYGNVFGNSFAGARSDKSRYVGGMKRKNELPFEQERVPPPPPIPPSGPPKINLQPYDKNSSRFFYRLKKAYNDPTSNGVFGSMIFNNPTLKQNFMNQVKLLKDNLTYESPQLYLDGSGSIIRKDIYTLFYGAQCNFGFIWDTDWLKPTNKKPLVSCLFPADAWSCPFKDCVGENNKGENFDSCTKKAADTSKPNRCSSGLSNWYNHLGQPTWPEPNECTRNIGYKFHEPTVKDPHAYIDNYSLRENCFESMVKEWRQFPGTKTGTLETYNEGVFLEDIRINGIEVNDGFKELNKLNRPLPSAILFNYNNKLKPGEICMNKSSEDYNYYLNVLEVLKSNFTPDTLVIKISGNTYKNWNEFNVEQFENYTTLDKMPGYNEIDNKKNCSKFNKNNCVNESSGNCMWYNQPGQTAICAPALKGPCGDFGGLKLPLDDCDKCDYGWHKSPGCSGNTREACMLFGNPPDRCIQTRMNVGVCQEATDYDSCMGGTHISGHGDKPCKWDWQKNTCTDP